MGGDGPNVNDLTRKWTKIVEEEVYETVKSSDKIPVPSSTNVKNLKERWNKSVEDNKEKGNQSVQDKGNKSEVKRGGTVTSLATTIDMADKKGQAFDRISTDSDALPSQRRK